MEKEIYKGVFLAPNITFLDTFSDKDDSTEGYWSEIGNILDIADCITFTFRNFDVNINLHKIGLCSIKNKDLLRLISENKLEESIDRLAYHIFCSLTGVLDGYFLSNTDFPYSLPIETFYHDTKKNTYHRNSASTRFMYVTMHSNSCFENAQEKSSNLNKIMSNGWSSITIPNFKSYAKRLINEKNELNFSEEYYYLISSLYRNRYLAYNEGILLTGWTICEYLINHLLNIEITKEEQERRRSYFDDKDKFPWAFKTSNDRLRSYSELKRNAKYDVVHKMNVLSNENKINHTIKIDNYEYKLQELLTSLREQRNNFVHNPSSKKSLEILCTDNFKLFNKTYQSICKLREIIKIRKLERKKTLLQNESIVKHYT